MKKTSKKLLSFLLAFGMILSMFAVTSVTGWAADEHVPASATLVAYPKPATESLASLSSKVSRLKSSNKAVVTVKLSKSTYGTSQTYYMILAVPKKAGTATVSFKCQGKTYKIKVTVKEADIVMKNSEIIADKAHPYSLEVISHIGENTFTYDPSSLSWSIEDPTVCKIENGILTGIKNGTTNITGSIGNFSGNMKVTVEIPESPKIPADDFYGWTTKSISSITDAAVTPSGNNQAILGFTYKTGRLPYVEMDKAITLYSIPDTLRMLINSEIPVSKIQIACKANGDKEQYLEYEGITVNEDYLISIPLSDITGENNRGGFPVSLNYIKFYINTTGTNSGQAYKIHIKEFSLVYNGIESGIDETVTGNKNMVVYPNPITGNTLFLQGENIVPGSSIRIYDRVGALILEQLLDETGIVNIGNQQPGVYIVNVQNELGTHVCKIVIQ